MLHYKDIKLYFFLKNNILTHLHVVINRFKEKQKYGFNPTKNEPHILM